MRLGRPSKFKKEYCKRLIDHMKLGKSYETFAAELMVDPRQLYHWEEQHKDFLQAKKLGMSLALRWWEELGKDGAQGIGGFNATAWIFTMKCRFRQFGYRDKFEDDPKDTHITVTSSSSVENQQLSALEAAKLYIAARKEKK